MWGMFKLRTIVAILAVAFGLGLLGTVIDPESLIFLAAFLLGGLLVSLTDPYTFGWTDHK